MNRTERRNARHRKAVKPKAPAANPIAILQACRPYDPGEVSAEIVECRLAYHRLTTGCGTVQDFDLVAMTLNAIAIRCEDIHPQLVAAVRIGMKALSRVQTRYKAGLPIAFDGPGIGEMSEALEVFEAVVEESSPMQMTQAIREAYRRIRCGILI